MASLVAFHFLRVKIWEQGIISFDITGVVLCDITDKSGGILNLLLD